MILAAGFGMRMQSLTKNIPKPLLKINNSTLLTNTINFFENLGCKKFLINTHYLHENLKAYINLKHSNKNIYLIYESQILDTGGGVKNSIMYFDSKNFLVVNADIYWDESNINDVNNFIDIIDQFENYFLLLSNQKNDLELDNDSQDKLVKRALLAAKNSYAPYSKSYSGLAVMTKDSRVFYGSYAENGTFEGEIQTFSGTWSATDNVLTFVVTSGTEIDETETWLNNYTLSGDVLTLVAEEPGDEEEDAVTITLVYARQ